MADSSVSKRDRVRWAVLLTAACLVSYANGITGAFTYDDKAIVRDNPRIRTPANLSGIFTTSYFGGPRGSGSAYRPVLLASYAVQWWIHEGRVEAFHFVNVLLHLGVTLLLGVLLLRIGTPASVAAAATLLFAVHPIHVEAVTSLVGRGETLAALFVLLFLHLALRVVRGESRRGLALAGALVCYLLALLTKEGSSAAPALLFLLAFFAATGPGQERLRIALLRGFPVYAGSLLVLAGVFALRSRVLGGFLKGSATGIFEVENALAAWPPAPRAANACVIFFRYLGRSLFPLHLSADESAWSIRPLALGSPLVLAAVTLLAALVFFAVARLCSGSVFALGLLFFGIALLPAGNLLFPIGTIFAERIAYLPSAGACLILGACLVGRTTDEGRPTRGCQWALVGVVCLFAARTIVRNAVWWSDDALFANSLRTAPASAKAHYNEGSVRGFHRQYRAALFHYVRAVEIYDGYWDAWAGKGRMEKELGRLEDAERSYEKSVRLNPWYENGFFGLGLLREARGNLRGAEEAYRRGLAQKPDSLPLAYRLALVRSQLHTAEALRDWRRALSLSSDSAAVRADFAGWLFHEGKAREGARQARQALRRDPACLPALRLLAERNARENRTFAEGLAREKVFRLSRSREDLALLLRAARKDASYGDRFRQLRPSLRKLAPRAFRGAGLQ